MAKTYLDKNEIKPVGVSKVRTFGGPVDLKISDTPEGFTDNFPMGLTAFDLFGATIEVDNGLIKKMYIADAVYDSEGSVYFKLDGQLYSYEKTTGRVRA